MGTRTGISWTDATWNPWQGCHKVSQGCKNCYMYTEKTRYGQAPATVVRSKPHTFNMPLRLKEPQRVFTCSWSDFFIEEADEWRDEALLMMARTPHLTYQVLTKRPEHMQSWMKHWYGSYTRQCFSVPLSNVWLGVSIEDQATADERIPWLLKTPAAVRFVSYEPALGPVDFTKSVDIGTGCYDPLTGIGTLYSNSPYMTSDRGHTFSQRLDWIICGGESGPGARPCNLVWLRSVVEQCQAAGVACWVKQLGARPYWEVPYIEGSHKNSGPCNYDIRNRKGAEPSEWPEDLRVQQWPAAR